MTKECELCTKRNTDYCPAPIECYETIDKPHYQNRVMLLEENAQLKQKLSMQKDSNKLLSKAIMCDNCDCGICEAHKQNIRLEEENTQLKEEQKIMGHNYTKYIQERDRRIQKAINYINKHQEQKYNPSLVLADYELKELLEILETECNE